MQNPVHEAGIPKQNEVKTAVVTETKTSGATLPSNADLVDRETTMDLKAFEEGVSKGLGFGKTNYNQQHGANL